MADLAQFFHDPIYSPDIENVLRFWDDPHLDLALESPQDELPPPVEPINHPTSSPQPTNDINNPSHPVEDPLIWDSTDNPTMGRDHGDNQAKPTGFFNESVPEYVNAGYENTIPLAVWPPAPVPFCCSCCQVLREIIHYNGTDVIKLEIHGRVGIICHAIQEIRYGFFGPAPKVEHFMIDFSTQSIERVKQFLEQYCQGRREAGFVMNQDPLSAFYDALCAGQRWDESTDNTVEFIQPLRIDSGVRPTSHPVAESHANRPGSSLAAQRERTGRLTLEDLKEYFPLPIEEAAKKLELCLTAVKKICRKYGMKRWPHRKIKSLDRQIENLELSLRANNGGDARTRAEIERLRQERAQILSGVASSS